MQIELKRDELNIINIMRKNGPYANFKVEKRPTQENPDGEFSRITVENSILLRDLIVIEKPM